MKHFILRDVLGWGFILWLVGYLLGIVLYGLVRPDTIGWILTPIGIGLTCFVLWKWVQTSNPSQAMMLGLGWSAVAIAGDYVFLVKLLNPPDGYYKFDVYLYYLTTLILPIGAGWLRRSARSA